MQVWKWLKHLLNALLVVLFSDRVMGHEIKKYDDKDVMFFNSKRWVPGKLKYLGPEPGNTRVVAKAYVYVKPGSSPVTYTFVATQETRIRPLFWFEKKGLVDSNALVKKPG